jgi:hypothetical protein
MVLTEYNFQMFPYVDGYINIPADGIFYRGIDSPSKDIDILRPNIPIYLSSKKIALEKYAKSESNLYCISNNVTLKLIDIRKVMTLLPMIIDSQNIKRQNIKRHDAEFNEILENLCVSLGLVDLDTQLAILNAILKRENVTDTHFLNGFQRLVNYAKQVNRPLFGKKLGIRIGITDIDGYTMMILKELLHDYCDGIIAPKIISPLQDDAYLHEEIIVFNIDNLRVVDRGLDKKIHVIHVKDINDIITQSNQFINFKCYNKIKFEAYVQKGGSSTNDKNDFYDDKIKVRRARRLAKKFAKKIAIKFPQEDTQSTLSKQIEYWSESEYETLLSMGIDMKKIETSSNGKFNTRELRSLRNPSRELRSLRNPL